MGRYKEKRKLTAEQIDYIRAERAEKKMKKGDAPRSVTRNKNQGEGMKK
jgi:hypothetical protein